MRLSAFTLPCLWIVLHEGSRPSIYVCMRLWPVMCGVMEYSDVNIESRAESATGMFGGSCVIQHTHSLYLCLHKQLKTSQMYLVRYNVVSWYFGSHR
jgi:hypothetical protein